MIASRTAWPPDAQEQGEQSALRPSDAAVQWAITESRRDILAYLVRRLGSPEAAADVLQAFALRALQRSGDLCDVQRVRGWLARVLASTIADYQRTAMKTMRREIAMDDVDQNSGAFALTQEEDAAVCNCLHKILPTLKPEYAEIVWRADLLGEPRDRIAATLGMTANNVTVRLHRGRQALRKRLEETCLTCPEHGFLDCRCEPAR